MKKGRPFLLCIIILANSFSALSQAISKHQQVTNDLTNAFRGLELQLQVKQSEDSSYTQVSDAFTNVSFLLGRCLNTLSSEEYYGSKKNIIDRYFKELANYQSLIEGLDWINQIDSLNEILHFIEEDLSLKYDTSTSASSTQSGLVKLRVRVLDPEGSRELRGYQVFVKPEISLDPRLIENLNPTNNAVKEIVPGRKLIWIVKNGQRLAQRKEGIRKSDRPVTVDFILPEAAPER